VDKKVEHIELVDKIRIIAVASTGQSNSTLIGFPQIQVFAGEPVLPTMTFNNVGGIVIRASDLNAHRVFDKEIGGSNIASIGPRRWYMNQNRDLLEDVAASGHVREVYQGDYESKCWLSLKIPHTQLLGFLYSIDNLLANNDQHANTSYAASLYFEGRKEFSDNATTQSIQDGQWQKVGMGLISLDNCIGRNDFGISTTTLVHEADQAMLPIRREMPGKHLTSPHSQQVLSVLPIQTSMPELLFHYPGHVLPRDGLCNLKTVQHHFCSSLKVENQIHKHGLGSMNIRP